MDSISQLLKNRIPVEKRKIDDDVKIVVRAYLDKRGLKTVHFKMNKELKKKYPYPRMAARAKRLIQDCDGKLGDAIWAVEYGNYWL